MAEAVISGWVIYSVLWTEAGKQIELLWREMQKNSWFWCRFGTVSAQRLKIER